jgi:uncharacterized protein (TIGR01777 family)
LLGYVYAAESPQNMRVLITGATGTIGRAITAALIARGDEVVALSRNPQRAADTLGPEVELHEWAAPTEVPPPKPALSGAEAVIHLLGEPIAQRWSDEAKRRIRDSRVLGTRMLVEGLASVDGESRGRTLIAQSATGIYGPSDDRPLDEDAPAGEDFLAEVVTAWEHEALVASRQLRVVLPRTGVVLTKQGGALAKMLPFFRLGVGGPVAGGRQYIPWIHLEDVVGVVLWCLAHEHAEGPLNLTAPSPVTNAEFSKALGKVLGRPAILPVPGLALRALYGEMAEVITTGQRAVPAKLEQSGYEFGFPRLEPALRDVLKRT